MPKRKPKGHLSTPGQYGLSANPHAQFVQDLIKGLGDGSIQLRSVQVQRSGMSPHIEMVIEAVQLDPNARTLPGQLYNGPVGGAGAPGVATAIGGAGATAQKAAQGVVAQVAALPGATHYGKKGIRLSTGEEPVTGYRDFQLIEGAYGLHLKSRNGAIWPPRKRMRALCKGNPFVDHDAPGLDCECGVYAYDTPDHARLQSGGGTLWGEIAMWGDVLICETGFRAQYAYPSYLFLRTSPNSRATKTLELVRSELEDSYGVPVMIVPERSGKSASQIMDEALSALLKEKA